MKKISVLATAGCLLLSGCSRTVWGIPGILLDQLEEEIEENEQEYSSGDIWTWPDTEEHEESYDWDDDDYEEESLLMRVCFYVMFYKSEQEFEDDDYEFFAKLFDDAPTVNQAFWLLDFFYGEFNDKQQKRMDLKEQFDALTIF